MKRREFIQKLGLSSLYFSMPLFKDDFNGDFKGDKVLPGYGEETPDDSGYNVIQGKMTVDGRERTFWYGMSDDPRENYFEMLVLCLHPSGGNGYHFWGGPIFTRELSRRYKALFVFPDGTSEANVNEDLPPTERIFFWNVGYCCLSVVPKTDNGVITDPGVDDTHFLARLAEKMAGDFNISRNNVCVMGHSNGGMMSQRCAAEAPLYGVDIAAFASSAGPAGGYVPYSDIPVRVTHNPNDTLGPDAKKISALISHGVYDECTPYYGGPGACGEYISFAETADYWKTFNNAELESVEETGTYREERYIERLPEGIDVSLNRRAEVVLLTGQFGHEWPDMIGINERIMDFFARVTMNPYT